MLTRELLRREMERSERLEEQIYMDLTLTLLNKLQAPLRELYDIMFTVTRGLGAISVDALQSHPQIIKMLRYATAPTISQMRLGQIAGLRTTAGFEEKQVIPTPEQAQLLVRWFREHVDQERFPWIVQGNPPLSPAEFNIAQRYAKLWTVSLIANQNTATDYRNHRKEQQEDAIARALEQAGLAEQRKLGVSTQPQLSQKPPDVPRPRRIGGITTEEAVLPGHYVREQKILVGEKKQKADLTARPDQMKRLICIEAKAVGIRIDSTKRLKELNDKYTDWANSGLQIITSGVCAGFFNDIELIATTRGRGIPIFWEHNLDRLIDFVRQGVYYGSSWNPGILFPDVPDDKVREGLAAIRKAPRTIAEEQEEYKSEPESGEP